MVTSHSDNVQAEAVFMRYSNISLMMTTGWFLALPLWWSHIAMMALQRRYSKIHTQSAMSQPEKTVKYI